MSWFHLCLHFVLFFFVCFVCFGFFYCFYRHFLSLPITFLIKFSRHNTTFTPPHQLLAQWILQLPQAEQGEQKTGGAASSQQFSDSGGRRRKRRRVKGYLFSLQCWKAPLRSQRSSPSCHRKRPLACILFGVFYQFELTVFVICDLRIQSKTGEVQNCHFIFTSSISLTECILWREGVFLSQISMDSFVGPSDAFAYTWKLPSGVSVCHNV